MTRILLIIMILCLWSTSAPASPLLERYTEAMEQSRSGNPEEAVRTLEALFEAHPEDRLADDILFQIARIHESRLEDYDGAVRHYERLITLFPRSRHARRAQAVLKRLAKGRAQGDAVFREYNTILRKYRELGGKRALERMEALVKDSPDFSLAEKAWLFIAQERRRLEDYSGAVSAYQFFMEKFPTTQNRVRALRAIGECRIESRDFAQAREAFTRLSALGEDNGPARRLGAKGLERVRTFTIMKRLYILSLVLIVLHLTFVLSQIRWRSLNARKVLAVWPEALVLTLLLMGVWSGVRDRGPVFTRSVVLLWAGGLFFCTCNNLYIQSRLFTKYYFVAWPLAVTVSGLALGYAIYHGTDLANLLWDSLMYTREFGR